MGVDTKAILRKGTTIEQIEKAISDKYAAVEVSATRPDFIKRSVKPTHRNVGGM